MLITSRGHLCKLKLYSQGGATAVEFRWSHSKRDRGGLQMWILDGV
jgi:hypothetical protein